MLIKVVLHGSLKGRFPEFEIDGATAAEVIEGWGRQSGMGDIPLDKRPVVDIVDFPTRDALYGLLPEGTTELHLIPAMFGGGGGIGKIIIGTVIAAAGVALIATGVGGPWGAALISLGVGIAMGGVTQLFMRSPKMDSKSSTDDEGSKYINGATNSTAIGTRIGYGGGRMRVGGQFMSLQVNSSDMVYGQFPATVPA